MLAAAAAFCNPDVRMVGKVKAETEENIRYEEYRGGEAEVSGKAKRG